MRELMKRFMGDESGQGLTEYVLIIALVSVGLILILVIFRDAIGDIFFDAKTELDKASVNQYQPGGAS